MEQGLGSLESGALGALRGVVFCRWSLEVCVDFHSDFWWILMWISIEKCQTRQRRLLLKSSFVVLCCNLRNAMFWYCQRQSRDGKR